MKNNSLVNTQCIFLILVYFFLTGCGKKGSVDPYYFWSVDNTVYRPGNSSNSYSGITILETSDADSNLFVIVFHNQQVDSGTYKVLYAGSLNIVDSSLNCWIVVHIHGGKEGLASTGNVGDSVHVHFLNDKLVVNFHNIMVIDSLTNPYSVSGNLTFEK